MMTEGAVGASTRKGEGDGGSVVSPSVGCNPTAVIIPTLDPESDRLADCLGSLVGSMTGAFRIQHDENREGFAATCNRGAKSTEADVLVFLNDDTIPQPGWLEALVTPLEQDGIGIVGARLTYPDGSIQHSGVVFARHADGIVALNRHVEAESGPVPAVTGACLAITRELFDTLGGFDEAFVNGYEDVDLCLRAQTVLGEGCWYAAESNVVHLESQSEGRFDHVAHNVDLLQRRWGWLPTT